MQCDTGTSPFQYSLQGSNAYYIKLQIANTRCVTVSSYTANTPPPIVTSRLQNRVPVAAVTLNGVAMSKTIDNYWLATATQSPGYVLPLPITITSILNDTVTGAVLLGLVGRMQWSDAATSRLHVLTQAEVCSSWNRHGVRPELSERCR